MPQPSPTALLAFAGLFVVVMLRANATYWAGRALAAGGGRTRWARHLEGEPALRVRAFVTRWGVWAVPLCFLTVGIQTGVNLTVGAARMPLRRYLPAVTVGSLAWATLYATLGLAALEVVVRVGTEVAVVALALAVAAAASWWLLRRRRSRARVAAQGVRDRG